MSAALFDGTMQKQNKPRFTPEFRLESAQLLLDQSYGVQKTAQCSKISAEFESLKNNLR